MGGVKCQPFIKRSNYWKRALKLFSREAGAQFPEAVDISTAKESLRSTKRGSLQVLAVIETALYNCNKLRWRRLGYAVTECGFTIKFCFI